MATIYVYKFKDNKLDVFEADTKMAAHRSDGRFFPSRVSGNRAKEIVAEFTKCLVNHSGKGITQYNKRCVWIICEPGKVFRNMMWLDEYNISKAIEIFKEYNDSKISEYIKLLSELEESNKRLDDCISLCNHRTLDGCLSVKVVEDGICQCKICGKKFSSFEVNMMLHELKGSIRNGTLKTINRSPKQ